jgi:phosphoglycerate dehydrogenase-like enzyme
MRHIVTSGWVAEGYSFPEDVKVTYTDDLSDVSRDDLASAQFVVLPYLGSSIDDDEAISRMRDVEVIQTITAGFNHLTPLVPAGVKLCNVSGVHDVATSEMAALLTLAALRELPRIIHAQGKKDWLQFFSESLWNKSVLLIGYGDVGKATYRRLLPFECQIIPVASQARQDVRGVEELDELLPAADVVILTVPLNDSTHHLMNKDRLALMKDSALLVNVARGQVVDQEALINELKAGRLRAALDVTDPEPLPAESPLWDLPNVLLAAHLGGEADSFWPRARARIQSQWDLWLAGKPLECVVVN